MHQTNRGCAPVDETTARGCCRGRFRDSAIPADVFWKADRLWQAGPGPVPGTGPGWTSAALVQGGRSCETALPTLTAVGGQSQGPGAKGRASPEPCLGFTSSPGSLLRAGRAADAWGVGAVTPQGTGKAGLGDILCLSTSLGHGDSQVACAFPRRIFPPPPVSQHCVGACWNPGC